MSGRAFSFLTPVVVAVIGVGTGIAIFQPALKDDAAAKPPPQPLTSSLTSASTSTTSTSPITSTTSSLTSSSTSTNSISNNPTTTPTPTSPSRSAQLLATEANVANAGGATRIPRDASRWAEVQPVFGVVGGGFEWSRGTGGVEGGS